MTDSTGGDPGRSERATFGSRFGGVQWVPPITEQGLFNVAPFGLPGGDRSDAPFQITRELESRVAAL